MKTEFNLKGKPINTNPLYELYVDDQKIYYYKNGLLHREAGPAIVMLSEAEQYTNLSDKDLYIPMEKPLYPPLSEPYTDANISDTILNILSNESEYHLNGKQYTLQEFNSIILEKELSHQLQTNVSTTKKLKV